MINFWNFLWSAFLIFAFVMYLMILIGIISDLFRDTALSGWYKVLWIFFLLWVPYITAFVYLIARGRSMAEREQAAAERGRSAATEYIREVAGSGPANEIAAAKSLMDSGAITAEEFAALKAKVLA